MKIITFGCRLNIFESEVIKQNAVGIPDDVILINSCAVTGEAERQCRQTIRKIKKQNPNAYLIVAGCAAQLHPQEYAAMPEVDRVLGNREKLTINALTAPEKILADPISDAVVPLPPLMRFEDKSKAFLQIQQGCNHACTFCIVRHIRGKNTGLLPKQAVAQARAFLNNGFNEIILTGVDVTAYPYGFSNLIQKLLTELPDLKRLRFGSLDPAALDNDFIRLMGAEERLMPHLHLSIQAGDDLILKRMGRRHTAQDIITLTEQIRRVRPQTTFGADFITGFPTETESQFNNTLQLVERAGLTHLHVFPFSPRSGTPAAQMPSVDVCTRKERAKRLRELGEKQMAKLYQALQGKTVQVLLEKSGVGFCENYVKVYTTLSKPEGTIVPLTIKGIKSDGVVGHT